LRSQWRRLKHAQLFHRKRRGTEVQSFFSSWRLGVSAPHSVRVAHFREDFTTDFTDFTDENLALRIVSPSVKSVKSVVQFFLIAALPLRACQGKRQPGLGRAGSPLPAARWWGDVASSATDGGPGTARPTFTGSAFADRCRGPVTKCSAGVLACEFWRRPAAMSWSLTGRDAR
jgi:hypothetical protein